MKRLSCARLPRGAAQIIGMMIFGSALMVFLVALLTLSGSDLVLGLILAVIILLTGLPVVRMRVLLDINDQEILIQCWPLLRVKVRISDICSAEPMPPTGVAEGFGYRILGRKRRGILVGGPCILLRCTDLTWIISVEDAVAVSEAITRTAESDCRVARLG